MSVQNWMETLATAHGDGPTLTTAARASCIPPAAKYPFFPGFWSEGKNIVVDASGRISCAVTTPGTGRFDLGLGGVAIMDSLAFPLNVAGKTNVGWWLHMEGEVRVIGVAATIFWQGWFLSEAYVGSPVPSVGGSGQIMLPYNTAPAVSPTFDTTAIAGLLADLNWTPSLGTASLTLHGYRLRCGN